MNESNGRRRLNGSAPALIRHLLGILVAGVAGVFALGVLWNQVEGTGDDVIENTKAISAIEKSINDMVTEQRLLKQAFDIEKGQSDEFRKGANKTLDRILRRLPRREGPAR